MSEGKDCQMEMLIQSLQLLAADAEVQIHALPSFVHVPDEIALIFSDAYLLADDLVTAGLIHDYQEAELDSLDKLLDQISGDKALWTLHALRASRQWEEIRVLARGILDSLGQERQKPNLFWLRYIRSQGDE